MKQADDKEIGKTLGTYNTTSSKPSQARAVAQFWIICKQHLSRLQNNANVSTVLKGSGKVPILQKVAEEQDNIIMAHGRKMLLNITYYEV